MSPYPDHAEGGPSWWNASAEGGVGLPLDWTVLRAWGHAPPRATTRGAGSRSAPGWQEFHDGNLAGEAIVHQDTAAVGAAVARQVQVARSTGDLGRWDPRWSRFVANNVGAWMHVERNLGRGLFAEANRRSPTPAHRNAIALNSMHRIRFGQNLALLLHTLAEEVPHFEGGAHVRVWQHDPAWAGVRRVTEQLAAVTDWAEAVFVANIVFEPLVGELFRNHLVQQACLRNGDNITSTVLRTGQRCYAGRDLRYTTTMFGQLAADREFAMHNLALMDLWLAVWVPPCLDAARQLQTLWSQPPVAPPRFEDGLDRARTRLALVLTDLGLDRPEELNR
ncbi:toluene hydroxylase [Rhodococcus sp. X156]|uniref:toluene hydroxylase n=1 Tax=Rhodococcus sp. X156 TaxID=2499145 RepID=UPI0013E3B0E4|nr:toluene hydroxylase [Rhodococcus sp. X156]